MSDDSRLRIIIPAYNCNQTIIQCVDALLNSEGLKQPPEIIVADNCNDDLLQSLLSDRDVAILKCSKYASAAYARNSGAAGFYSGILIFIDSDVVVEPDTIRNLIRPIVDEKSNATFGNYSTNTTGLNFYQSYKQLYINHIYKRQGPVIKNYFWSAICAVSADVFHQLGGFGSFNGATGEDVEFGIRLSRKGYIINSVQSAAGQHLHYYTGLGIIENDLRKGMNAIRQIMDHELTLGDNKHSGKTDVIAVMFAVATIGSILLGLFNPLFLLPAVLTFLIWFTFRYRLGFMFLNRKGVIFFIRAVFWMFFLDLIRAVCVGGGIYLHFWHSKAKVKQKVKEPEIIKSRI